MLRRLIDDGCGVAAIEYGLIATLIAVTALGRPWNGGNRSRQRIRSDRQRSQRRESRRRLTIASAVREWISAGRPLIYTGTGHDGGL